MLLIEACPRRKKLTALRFAEDTAQIECRRDSTGLPVIDCDLCAELALKPNTQLDEAQLLEIIAESERRRAKSRALWLLGRQAMCSGALYKKLKSDFPETAAAYAVERMVTLGLLDDEYYAERLAETLINEKRVAPRQAVYLMIQKGVDPSLAKQTMALRDDDPKLAIRALVEKKYSRKLSDEGDIRRTVAALQRKGFSYGDIRTVLDEFTKNYLSDSEFC